MHEDCYAEMYPLCLSLEVKDKILATLQQLSAPKYVDAGTYNKVYAPG